MTARWTRISHIKAEDVFDELARMLLFQADQIAATASRPVAEAFIGLALGVDGCAFRDLPTSRVDLRRFPVSQLFDEAVSFVTRPHPDHVVGDEIHKLRTFMFHSPRSGPHSAVSRKQQRFMRPWGLCRTVTDAAIARWKLEVDRRGEFSLRELALLADVTDAAALKSLDQWRREKPLIVSFTSYSTLPIEDAIRWLAAQHGFRSSYTLSEDDPRVRDRLAMVRSAEDLRDFVRAHRVFSAPFHAQPPKGGRLAELAAWERGGFDYDPTRAAAFARSLGLDVPLFVGKVLEVSLRESTRGRSHSTSTPPSAPAVARAS